MTGTSNLLILSPNWLGDAVMSVPALREARRIFEGWRIAVACRPSLRDLFEICSFVDEVLPIEKQPGRHQGIGPAELRGRGFDVAVIFQNSFRSAWTAWRRGARERFGYRGDGRGWLLTHAIERPGDHRKRHQVFDYLELMAAIERRMRGDSRVGFDRPDLSLQVDEEHQRRARELMEHRGLSLVRPFAVLNPGATNSRAKRWLPDRFATVSDRLQEEAEMTSVIVGTDEEREISQAVGSRAKHPVIDLTGRTRLGELLGVLSLAGLLITNDTGTSHLGAALGIPTVTIFGPTEEWATRPFSERARVVQRTVACAPCMLRDCPIDHRCMTGVSVIDVMETALSIRRTAHPWIARP